MRLEPGPVFERLKSLVIARTLHRYYDDKDAMLIEKLERRMAAVGVDAEGYLALLDGRATAAAEAEWGALFSEITINETFFFRFAEQFEALERDVLPTLIRARSAERRLRIWSAGCSTGAEPYSVAILLHRLLGEALADWSVSILGTDLDPLALEAARTAEYGDWALRTLGEAERRRDFLPVAGPTGRRWQLRGGFRRLVRFEQHNLLDLLDAPGPESTELYDLVLCRNVLIYFGAREVAALAARLGDRLASDGWLLLGHAESAMLGEGGLRRVAVRGTVAWRRAEAAADAERPAPGPPPARNDALAPPTNGAARRLRTRPAAVSVAMPPFVAAASHAPAAGRARVVPGGAAADAVAPDADPDPDVDAAAAVEAVRRLADAGRSREAALLCRAGLEAHPTCAPLFFYAALLHRADGRPDDAEADFRRAIYLGKQFAMAHYHLGLLLLDRGRPGQGRRAIAEARRIAASLPPDAPLEAGDGITAGRLGRLTSSDMIGGDP